MNTYLWISQIYLSNTQNKSLTHESLDLVNSSIRFTVLKIRFHRIEDNYPSFYPKSPLFVQNAWVVVYNSWIYIFEYLQALSKYLRKPILTTFHHFRGYDPRNWLVCYFQDALILPSKNNPSIVYSSSHIRLCDTLFIIDTYPQIV